MQVAAVFVKGERMARDGQCGPRKKRNRRENHDEFRIYARPLGPREESAMRRIQYIEQSKDEISGLFSRYMY
jgi:hypothetical protein